MNSRALTIDGVAKWWTPDSGLRPVSFTVDSGEIVVVRGRSGSGKSTLLALIAGWTTPDEGSVALPTDVARDAWTTVAVVPQVLALVPELTVLEQIDEALATSRTNRSERRSRVAAALVALDLAELARRLPADTSMGQQQRTAIARAAVARPLVLLADEPTSHQDAGHVEVVIAAFRSVTAFGTAVVVTSHDPAMAAAADRIIDL